MIYAINQFDTELTRLRESNTRLTAKLGGCVITQRSRKKVSEVDIREALRVANGVKSHAALALGMNKDIFQARCRGLGLVKRRQKTNI